VIIWMVGTLIGSAISYGIAVWDQRRRFRKYVKAMAENAGLGLASGMDGQP
jgi:membrane protein DedA with SNARE-associated domain